MMTTDLDPQELCRKLTLVYERYLLNPRDDENQARAISLYSRYFVTAHFIDERLRRALDGMSGIGIQEKNPLPAEQAHKILAGLHRLKEEMNW